MIADCIAENLTLFNEKRLVNLLNFIKWYEDSGKAQMIPDNGCDFLTWQNLKEKIREEYKKRDFELLAKRFMDE